MTNLGQAGGRRYLYLLFSLGILAALNYGIMVTNTPYELIRKYAELTGFDINKPEIVSAMSVGTSVGAMIAQFTLNPIVSRLGIFKSLFVFLPLDILFNILNCFPVHYAYFLVVMIGVGFCTGSYLSLIPVLASNEVVPHIRGMYMTTVSISINTGLLFGYIINLFVSLIGLDYECWWLLNFTCVVFCILTLVFLVLTYHCYTSMSQAKREDMILCEEKEIASGTSDLVSCNDQASSQNDTYASTADDIVPTGRKYTCKQINRMVWISIILGTVQMTTGINSMLTYASLIFSQVFTNDPRSGIFGSMIVGACNLVAVCLAFPFIRRFKRKILLMIGLFGCVVTNIVIAITFGVKDLDTTVAEHIKISMFVLFVLFYQLAPGPVILMLCGEVFPRDIRVRMCSIGFGFNWAWNIIVIFTYRFFAGVEYIVHSLYATVTFILTVALLIITPETLNRSEEDIEQEILKQ